MYNGDIWFWVKIDALLLCLIIVIQRFNMVLYVLTRNIVVAHLIELASLGILIVGLRCICVIAGFADEQKTIQFLRKLF